MALTLYKKKYISHLFFTVIKIFCFISLVVIFQVSARASTKVIIYPAPAGEILDHNYRVFVENKRIDVYSAKVAAGNPQRRFKAVDDLMHSADYFDNAAFCYFEIAESTRIIISINSKINNVKILPTSYAIRSTVSATGISFMIKPGQNLTVEVNGDEVHSLHIFANPIEYDKPNPVDSHVIYFGPGIHEVTNMLITDNQTVYIAGGAVVRAVIGKDEKYGMEPSGLRNYAPTFILMGHHIKFMGQGIVDASACPTHSRNLLIAYRAHDVSIQGIIFQNSSSWTVPIVQSDSVSVKNIKIIGYRTNSDGIDINNSSNVIVDNCFVRTNDDLIVIKTFEHQSSANNITVKNCVLWNQLADALSIGGELRENVSNVVFSHCDIIHDSGREWSLRIFQCDSSTVNNIRFEDINVEESHKLISLWIGKAGPSYDKNLGHIKNVFFRNIKVNGSPPIEIIGGSQDQQVSNVDFANVSLNNKALSVYDMRTNNYVNGIIIKPVK